MEDIEMARQYVDLDRYIKELTRQRDELGVEILKNHSEENICGILRREVKRTVVPEKLQAIVSPSLWTNITKRTPVAALVKAAVVKGQISESDLDSCKKDGKPYLKVI